MSNFKVNTYRLVRVLEDAAVAVRTNGVMDVRSQPFLNSALVYDVTGQIHDPSPKMESAFGTHFIGM